DGGHAAARGRVVTRLLGLEIAAGEVRVARGERSFGTLRLTALERRPLASPAALPGVLTELARTRADVVLTALPAASAPHRFLTLPFRDRGRLVRTAPLELLGQLPLDPAGLAGACEPLGPAPGGSAVLAAAVRRDELEAHGALLAGAGLAPARVDLAPLPAWNLLPATRDDQALVVADGGESALALRRGGRLAGLRPLGASAREPAALASEVRWSLAALGGAPATVVVAGADAGQVLARALAAATGARVVRGSRRRPRPPRGARRGSGARRAPWRCCASSRRACRPRCASTWTSSPSSATASSSTAARRASTRSMRSAARSPPRRSWPTSPPARPGPRSTAAGSSSGCARRGRRPWERARETPRRLARHPLRTRADAGRRGGRRGRPRPGRERRARRARRPRDARRACRRPRARAGRRAACRRRAPPWRRAGRRRGGRSARAARAPGGGGHRRRRTRAHREHDAHGRPGGGWARRGARRARRARRLPRRHGAPPPPARD